MKKFEEIKTKKTFPEIENEVLQFWKNGKIFERSVQERSEDNPYVFVDGPPFVSGNPHYASLLPSIAKDVIPRFFTMKGKRVRRVWGWDCHGLPIEEKVNDKLGIKSRAEVEENIGVANYVKACRDFVNSCISNWEWYIDKVGRWVDLENAYYTMNPEFNESVIWGFKQMYEKDYIYKGKRVSLYSTDTSTPVSDFEVAMDPDNYRDTEDLSVFVKFELVDNPFEVETEGRPLHMLAWTTTPWTIPSNFALAVNSAFEYVLVKFKEEYFVVAKDRVSYVFDLHKDQVGEHVLRTFKGDELEGLSYTPVYDFFVDQATDNDFKVYTSNDVTGDEGTGILHIAPAFGEVDFNLGFKHGLSAFSDIDNEGNMNVGDWKGMYLRKASKLIASDMENLGSLFRSEIYNHRLPYYRGKNPLIYMAQDAYFVNLKEVNKNILKENKGVNWVPDHFKEGRFAKTVEGAPDWCISRNRYWATIMPIWKSDDGDELVVGSIEEIASLTNQVEVREVEGVKKYFVSDEPFRLHRDICDKLVLVKDGKEYKRVPEVLDVWMDSGSVPFAEYHYPFENKETFEKAFPADYIVEYTGQIRAWFQMLFRVSTMIFGKAPFTNVVVTGVLAGTDGRKMSKSFGNYPDPKQTLESIGGDALRLYFMSSPIMLGENANFDEVELKNKVRNVLLPYFNSLNYFLIYASKHEFVFDEKVVSSHVLDVWIRAKLDLLTQTVNENLQAYQIPVAVRAIEDFVTDLSTWYVRRSRDRISDGDQAALSTFYTVLLEFTKVAAPVIPFITEYVYEKLVDVKQDKVPDSVHLCFYPEVSNLSKEQEAVIKSMDLVREVVSLTHSLRTSLSIPVRQPLQTLELKVEELLDNSMLKVILSEVNVKDVKLVSSLNKNYKTSNSKDVSIALDTKISKELELEGAFRELVRKVQNQRKKLGLSIEDKIMLVYPGNSKEVVDVFGSDIKSIANVSELKKGDKLEVVALKI